MRVIPPPSLALVFAIAVTTEAPAAGAQGASAADAPIEIEIEIRRARGPGPAPGAASAYSEAKRRLDRGRPAEALGILARARSELLEDRESLLRGDALLALGHEDLAKAAYLNALKSAQLRTIAVAAARGLINVHGQLGERAQQLRYTDALLAEEGVRRRASLLLERASLLEKLGRKADAAEAAWRITIGFPTAKVMGEAEAMLTRLERGGTTRPETSVDSALAQARNLWKSGAYRQASSALDALEKRAPEMRRAIMVERTQMYAKQGQSAEELRLLTALEGEKLETSLGVQVLERLGKLAMRRSDNAAAIGYFNALASKYPKSRRAPEVQYLAAWLPYNDQDFAIATDALSRFAKRYPRWDRRPEALWFAGWSAYLGDLDARAEGTFKQLVREHGSSEMKLWAHYWTGRIREQSEDESGARTAYREVLRIAPMSYFGHWSISALGRLGEEVVLEAPAKTKPASIERALKVLGTRPINVDRGIALAAAGLTNEAMQELRGAGKALAKIRNTRGRVMVAEMINQLGGYHHAFRLAAAITRDGGDLVTGNEYAWRAWRLAYPRAFHREVDHAASTHDVDPFLVLSIMRTESAFRPWVRSPAGARGLMQVMPKTAKSIGRRAKGGRAHAARYTRPDSNIWLGTWYLRQLLDRYHGQLALAVGAYNAGPGAMDRWLDAHHGKAMDEFIEALSYRETRRYIRRVIETYQTYRRLDGIPPLRLTENVRREAPPKGAVSF